MRKGGGREECALFSMLQNEFQGLASSPRSIPLADDPAYLIMPHILIDNGANTIYLTCFMEL